MSVNVPQVQDKIKEIKGNFFWEKVEEMTQWWKKTKFCVWLETSMRSGCRVKKSFDNFGWERKEVFGRSDGNN